MSKYTEHQVLFYCGCNALHIYKDEHDGIHIGVGYQDSKPGKVDAALMNHETLFKLKQFIDWEVEKARFKAISRN